MKKYNHLTAEQRYAIEALLQQEISRKVIAKTIKVSQSTLCRELKRNSVNVATTGSKRKLKPQTVSGDCRTTVI